MKTGNMSTFIRIILGHEQKGKLHYGAYTAAGEERREKLSVSPQIQFAAKEERREKD